MSYASITVKIGKTVNIKRLTVAEMNAFKSPMFAMTETAKVAIIEAFHGVDDAGISRTWHSGMPPTPGAYQVTSKSMDRTKTYWRYWTGSEWLRLTQTEEESNAIWKAHQLKPARSLRIKYPISWLPNV